MWDKEKALSLRAHHGLCMAYFVGEGYSSGFKKHMAEVLQAVQPETPVRLAAGVDEICSACPHNCGGVCESPTVDSHDRAVLQACGLQKDQQLRFGGPARRDLRRLPVEQHLCRHAQPLGKSAFLIEFMVVFI